MELYQSPLGISPKRFYPVDMTSPIGKLALSMMNTIVFLIPQIHQAIIASPSI
jgi:hypothetical protein